MNPLDDLRSAAWIHAKGAMFLIIGFLAAALLFLQAPEWKTAALITVAVWAFCRFYYYLFYVLERYLGRDQKFSGIFDAIAWLVRRGK